MPTITGTETNDSLAGTAGDDTINGLGGNDSVSGSDGNDMIDGGGGNDNLRGDLGNDTIHGGDGDDSISGGGGADLVDGGAGNDWLSASVGHVTTGDQFFGGDGYDTINFYGNSLVDITTLTIGSDIEAMELNTWVRLTTAQLSQFSSISGACEVVGSGTIDLTGNRYKTGILMLGSGNEFVTLAGNTPTGSYTVWSGAGDDTIIGSEGNDSLDGGDGNDTIEGRGGADQIVGGAGNDTMLGGDGNDTFHKGFGTDIMDGGAGDDYFWVSIAEGFGSEDQIIGGAGYDTLYIEQSGIYQGWQDFSQYDITGIERFEGGNASFIMSVADIAQFQYFQVGSLQLSSAGTLTVGANFRVNDFVLSEFGNTVDLTAAPEYCRVLGGAGNDTITGTGHSDELRGGGGNDVIHAGNGADQLVGGAGVDWIDGGEGNDYLYILPGEIISAGDRYTGGSGTDNLLVGYDPDGGWDGTGTIIDLSAATIDPGIENLQGNSVRLSVAQVGSFSYIGLQNLYLSNGGAVDFSNITYAGNLYLSDAGNYVTASNVTSNWGINLFGGAGNDTFIGSSQALNDQLHGGGGSDTLSGGGGDDLIDGGIGADAMNGGVGNDSYFVDNAGDTVSEAGGGGLDSVQSSVSFTLGAGLEDLGLSGTGAINATGNSLDNRLGGNSGNNVLNGGAGADTMVGGNGNDTYIVDNVGDTVDEWGSDGTDVVQSSVTYTIPFFVENLTLTGIAAINGTGSSGANILQGNIAANILSGEFGADNLLGGDGNDTLYGGFDDDSLAGQNGDDLLEGGDGNDTLDGGAGLDTASYDSAQFGVNVSLAIAGAQDTSYGGAPGAGMDTLTSIENLYGSTSGDVLTGNAAANVLNGQDGNDTLEGGAGNDVVDGGTGTDNASYANAASGVTVSLALSGSQNTGGAGSDTLLNIENVVGSGFADTLTGNSGTNYLLGGAGDDALHGGDGADWLDGGLGNDALNGGAGADVVNYSAAVSGVTVNLSLLTAQNTVGAGTDTLSSVENLIGSWYNDTLTGDANANVFEGNVGNDTLNGGGGTDTASYETAMSGVTVNLGLATAQITGGAGTDTISNFENLFGSTFNDTLTGDGNANVIEGFGGNDVINGGAGIDTASYQRAHSGVTVTLGLAGAQNTGGGGTDTLSNMENVAGSVFNDTLTGDGGANALLGNGGDDYLMGGAGADSLTGGSGDDIFQGSKSDLNGDTIADLQLGDTIILTDATLAGFTFSLTGNTLTYSGGSLTLQGPLIGQIVASAAVGGGVQLMLQVGPTGGDDTLSGTEGDDSISGLGGNDALNGLGGNDYLIGGTGNDTIDGGEGNDTASYDDIFHPDGINVSLAIAGPQNTGAGGTDTLIGIENVVGSGFNDRLTGNAGDNSLIGGMGSDILIGGGGIDHLNGEFGSDLYIIAATADHTAAEISDNNPDGIDELRFAATVASTLTLYAGDTGIEQVVAGTGTGALADMSATTALSINAAAVGNALTMMGNAGDNTLTATAYDDMLNGGWGIDRLYGNGGNDTLDGGTDADKLFGGMGDDTYIVDHASDIVVENAGEGTDQVWASVNHTLRDNVENIVLTGIYSIYANGNALANTMLGNSGSNKLYGLAGDDTLIGSDGNDTLDGGVGADQMVGGAGNENYYVDDAGDLTIEEVNQGIDTVRTTIDHTLGANIENMVLLGTANLNGTGNALNNVMTGNAGNNHFIGGAGVDQLKGLGGNDTLDGGAGSDRLYGGTGHDVYIVDTTGDLIFENAGEGWDSVESSVTYILAANVENLNLTGSANINGTGNELDNSINGNDGANILTGGLGRDHLFGEGGADVLKAGDGDDWLEGGWGRDRFYGGEGADLFLFMNGDFAGVTSSTCDQIHDFSQAEGDRIELSLVDANINVDGIDPFSFLGTAAFTGTAGELRYQQISGNTYVQGDTDGDGTADFWIRLDGLHTLGQSDFVL